MPRLSIIIPVVENPAQMEDSLVSVLENRPADCEILVVTNRSYDDPYELKDEVRFVEAPHESRWIDLLNVGIGLSRGTIVHLLPCGVHASEGWVDAALAQFDDPHIAAVTPIVLDRLNPRRLLAAGVVYQAGSGRVSRLADRIGPARTAVIADVLADPDCPVAFYRRTALEQVGQFSDKAGPRFAGIDVAMALAEAGFGSLLEPRCRMLGMGARAAEDAFRRGQMVERLFWRWLPRKWRLTSLIRHAILVAGELTQGFFRPAGIAHVAGRITGCLQMTKAENYLRGSEKMVRQPKRVGPEAPHFPARTADANPSAANRSPDLVYRPSEKQCSLADQREAD